MSSPSRVCLSKLSLGLIIALAAAPTFAQSTSSGVAGRVTTAGGQPVAGAEVTITHVESGTSSRVTTDANGRYSASGLRPGGPYTVAVHSSAGDQSQSGVYLTLDRVAQVDETLGATAGNTLQTVTVTGSGASPLFAPDKAGAGTDVNRRTIEALPSASGNIQDLMRLDPRVSYIDRASGSISAGGQNPRYNAIRIDGVSASDTFGLEGNNMPTRRQPVSLEAVEAIKIDLSNYDVTINGGTGAVVNAVTKSGTNQFHGSVYGQYRSGKWFGRAPQGFGTDPKGEKFNGFSQERTVGFTLGGPIVKDKLFFFANYEKFDQAAPGADIAGSAIGAGRVSAQQIADAQRIFQGRYGVSAGDLSSNGNTGLKEYALKLDWNISDSQRASIRYSRLDQSKLRINGYGSTSSASLSSYWYQHDKSNKSTVAQLFSDWTDIFSTEMKLSYRDYSAVRNTPTEGTPSIQLAFGAPTATSQGVGQNPSLYLGTETNSQYNELFTKTWNFFGAGTLALDSHSVKFGVDYGRNKIYNIYAPYVDGALVYNSILDFQNNSPSLTQYRIPAGGNIDNMAAAYTFKTLGLFVQDQWAVNDALTLTYGLRADKFSTGEKPTYNPAVSAYWGRDNSDIGGDKFLWQPRFGFNYKLSQDHLAQIRGGIGLFQGDSPQVWLSNAFNTNGLNYTQVDTYRSGATAARPRQNVNFVAGDFQQPSSWKANLALDWELPWAGVIASAEVLASKVKTGLYYQRLDVGTPTRTAPDGRNMFWSNTRTGTGTARANGYGSATGYGTYLIGDTLLLSNTDKGGSDQLTFSLNKPFSRTSDWSWSLAYTMTHATEAGSLTSSTATSGWNYQYAYNTNENAANRARYEIRDRISGTLNWHHDFFGNNKTEVGLVYEGRSGRPYSWVYFNDMNGDGRSSNDLVYVPAGVGDVEFGTLSSTGVFTRNAAMEANFFAYLNGDSQLNRYRGTVAPVNGGRAPWVNTFDLRFSQEFPGFFRGNKAEFTVDVFNVGNLINKKWGHIVDYGFFADQRLVSYNGIDPATGKYVYSFTSPDRASVANADADGFNVGVSQWSIQLGLKYKF